MGDAVPHADYRIDQDHRIRTRREVFCAILHRIEFLCETRTQTGSHVATRRKAHHDDIFTIQAALRPFTQDAYRALSIGQRRVGAFVMSIIGQAIGHHRQGVTH